MESLERLLDLVQFLLSRHVPVTFTEIRDRMPDAYGQANLQTAKRMFERDKDLLREQGIPIETRPVDDLGGELGYIIDRRAYALPDVALTPEEIGALMVVAQPTTGDVAALGAVRKLLAGARDRALLGSLGDLAGPAEPRSARVDAAVAAAADRRHVRFPYRTADGVEGERAVDAWAVVLRAGRWYLVGLDVDRGEPRAFQIRRMVGDPVIDGDGSPRPAGFVAADHVGGSLGGGGARTARIAVAAEILPAVLAQSAGRVVGASADRTVVECVFDDVAWLASWVLSFGDRAVVEGPVDLRGEIVARLEAVARG